MIIIPAIDIIQGTVVRLHQGDFSKEKLYSDNPVEVARMWREKGAEFLHIVDLEGAKHGEMINRDVITKIIKSVDIPCEVGGGIRDDNDIDYFLQNGAKRVVVGTVALENTDYLKELVSRFDEKLVVSIDFSGGHVAKTGWQERTNLTPDLVAMGMENLGVKTIVVTDIATDGTLMGPNIDKLKKILASVDISVIASGGVSNLDDIKKLKALGSKNLEGVIVGRALYEGKIDLKKAIKAAK